MIHARKDYAQIQDPTNTIPANEPVFLLRAQDATAAEVVRYWCKLQEDRPDHSEHAIKLAQAHAVLMDRWPVHKTADVPENA